MINADISDCELLGSAVFPDTCGRPKCVGKILAYNTNKPGLITIIHEECFIGFKAHARDILSMVFDRLS